MDYFSIDILCHWIILSYDCWRGLGFYDDGVSSQPSYTTSSSALLREFSSIRRCLKWGNNTLDLAFSSEDNMISKISVGEKLGKSGHNMIRFEILISFTKLEKSFMKPNFRKADFSRLR